MVDHLFSAGRTASCIAAADWNRSAGSLASALATSSAVWSPIRVTSRSVTATVFPSSSCRCGASARLPGGRRVAGELLEGPCRGAHVS